jgi:hypothetical protein
MKKLLVTWAVVSVLCFQLVLADGLEERVRQAALVTHIHGITQEIAEREIGPEGVPVLLELLRDPDFPRRDNVVAFLVYLAPDGKAPALVDFLENPPGDRSRPEEYRATLMVPEALGRIAARGGDVARELLGRMEDDPRIQARRGLAQQVEHGLRLMDQSSDGAVSWQPEPDLDPPYDPVAIDPSAASHSLAVTYANHVDTNDKITDAELDAALEDVTWVMNFEHATNDTACCVQLARSGIGRTIGTPGDGLDVITTSSELNAVINNSTARVKVVDYIGWCGSPGSNIIGCGYTPGNGMVVVRMSTAANEGKLWAHELGHNTGLNHNPSTGFIMYHSFSVGNTKLSSYECNRYHYPSASAGITSTVLSHLGCHDNDNDGLVSTTDNCPYDANGNQADADADGHGDVCDNCPGTGNSDQADCDTDGLGDVCDPTTVPPPIAGLHFSTKETLSWSPIFYTKYVYRGLRPAGSEFVENHVRVDELSVLTSAWNEPAIPEPGAFFYYHVTNFNGCGESP